MATVNGFALIRKSDNVTVQQWSAIPSRIEYGVQPDGTALVRIDGAQSGWGDGTYTIGAYSWTVPDAGPPDVITDRQFYQQLAVQSIITQDEALAAVGPGTLPQTLVNLIAQLPTGSQFDARMKLVAAVQFHRSAALTDTLRQLFGWSNDQLDTFWRAAAALT